MLEIADREFQAIQDADQKLTENAREKVRDGRLQDVEITPDALKAFLDDRLGPDGRISAWSYEWTARLLKRLGFATLGQVKECIDGYDDDSLSRIVAGTRQGQTTRLEYMLLAGMGARFTERHPWAKEGWYEATSVRKLRYMLDAGVTCKEFDPLLAGAHPTSDGTQASAPAVQH